MDAFSVSLANGLSEPKMTNNKMALIATFFGGIILILIGIEIFIKGIFF